MVAADAARLNRMDAAVVAAAAAALHEADHAWVAGYRSCRAVAELLQYQLRLFRPDTVRLVGGSGPEDLDFGAFRRGDVVIVAGFAPYSRASVATARAARTARCTLIALADSPAAPADGADHFLGFDAATGPGFFPSLTGAISLAQALASATFALGGPAALGRLRETESRLAAQSQYVTGSLVAQR
jgi:DNA-binding MurR/RpiR family transcriptional regulator